MDNSSQVNLYKDKNKNIMAITKRSSKKKVSKLRKIVRIFNPRSLKGGMMLFALVFVISGAGYFAYRSFAATITSLTATDGYRGPVTCIDIYGYMKSGYGNFEPCMQYRNNYQEGRYGIWFYATGKFTPKTGWLKTQTAIKGEISFFKNCGGNTAWALFFASGKPLSTAYGKTYYGYAYNYDSFKAKLANYNVVTGNCYLEDPWFDTVGLHR